MDIQALKEQRVAALDKAKAIQDGADADGADLTEEEAAEVDALLDEAEARAAEIEKAQAASARKARLNTVLEDLDKSAGRNTVAGAVSQVRVTKEAWADDDNKGYKTPSEFLLDVMDAGRHHRISERLQPLRVEMTAGSDEQGGYADPYGGFLVPEGFSPDLLRMEAEADPMAGKTTKIPMATPSLTIPARVDKDHSSSVSGGLRVYRRAETDTVTASRMAFEQVRLEAAPLMGIAYATEEILTDSPISFAALLAQGFGDEITAKIVDERLNGTGVGEFMGVMNSPCLVSITKETGQAADTVLTENIIKMRSQVWGYNNAIWMANHDCLPQLMTLVLEIGAGGVPIYHTTLREDHADTLLGRPIVYTEYMQTLGDKGDLLCANWTQYLEATYQPLQGAESIHVRFIYNERAYRFTIRNAGAPWWRTYLTPKNSTAYLSPFVTLDARD